MVRVRRLTESGDGGVIFILRRGLLPFLEVLRIDGGDLVVDCGRESELTETVLFEFLLDTMHDFDNHSSKAHAIAMDGTEGWMDEMN